MREIVSSQFAHEGGLARVEQDQAGHLFVTCSGDGSGCKEHFMGCLAPALAALVDHVGYDAEPFDR